MAERLIRSYKDSAQQYEQLFRAFIEQDEEAALAQMNESKKAINSKYSVFGLWCTRGAESSYYGYTDILGKYVISPQYKYADEFNAFGLAHVSETTVGSAGMLVENSGYIDKTGGYVIAPDSYSSTSSFSSCGLAMICVEEQGIGFIDTKGAVVIQPQYEKAYDFDDDGLAPVLDKNGKFGVINTAGEYVVDPKFEYIMAYQENGLAAARILTKYEGYEAYDVALWGFIDREGNMVIEPQIGEFSSYRPKDDIFSIEQDGRWGVIDYKGSWLVESDYPTEQEAKAQYDGEGDYGYSGEKLTPWIERNYVPKPTQTVPSTQSSSSSSYCKGCSKRLTAANSTIDSSKRYCDSCLMNTYNDVINR